MHVDQNAPLPPPHKNAKRHGPLADAIRSMKNGDSLWVATTQERSTVRSLHWKLKKKGEVTLTMISRQVHEDDPRGPGYRLWTVGQRPEDGDSEFVADIAAE